MKRFRTQTTYNMNKYKCNKCNSIIQEGYEVSKGYFRYCEICNEDLYKVEVTPLPKFDLKNLSDEDYKQMFEIMRADKSFESKITYYKKQYIFDLNSNCMTDKIIYMRGYNAIDEEIDSVEYCKISYYLDDKSKKLIKKFYKEYIKSK